MEDLRLDNNLKMKIQEILYLENDNSNLKLSKGNESNGSIISNNSTKIKKAITSKN